MRALVVDDSHSIRKSLVAALCGLAGMVCDEAIHGADGLKKLAQERYDIVVTDVNMPVLDGLKLVHHIRQDPVHRTLPIVVVTTLSAAVDRARALALGADAYLVKPVQPKLVVDTVRGLLKLP